MVVYDSVYGNTEKIAQAIGNAIKGQVSVVRAPDANPSEVASLSLLVVGSPTQAFRSTKGVQKFIQNIPGNALRGIKVAAFDTRMNEEAVSRGLRFMMKMGGHAAKHIADLLEKKGGNLISRPEGFFVKDKEGPLRELELERAAGWAKAISEY
jgi:flavodoxin